MASDALPSGILNQRWIHSHEEDTANEMVFRPASYPFPPSRGRTGFELRPDGSALVLGVAPTDAPQAKEGKWTLDAEKQLLVHVPSLSETQAMTVVSSSPDKLVVKRWKA